MGVAGRQKGFQCTTHYPSQIEAHSRSFRSECAAIGFGSGGAWQALQAWRSPSRSALGSACRSASSRAHASRFGRGGSIRKDPIQPRLPLFAAAALPALESERRQYGRDRVAKAAVRCVLNTTGLYLLRTVPGFPRMKISGVIAAQPPQPAALLDSVARAEVAIEYGRASAGALAAHSVTVAEIQPSEPPGQPQH